MLQSRPWSVHAAVKALVCSCCSQGPGLFMLQSRPWSVYASVSALVCYPPVPWFILQSVPSLIILQSIPGFVHLSVSALVNLSVSSLVCSPSSYCSSFLFLYTFQGVPS
ncbi:hypothetical protein OTU49_000669 [Cherax quadricarinatus]|uniref:Uncharacterized protein n=1 Tax=Cherax quadricarinatus TaxID=27406 RepID=A0AAW0XM03_CHEQU